MAIADEWTELERALAAQERHAMYRDAIAAMRRLIDKIKADTRFRDLEPSLSHASLVFRRSAPHGVIVSWDGNKSYAVAFVDPGFEFKARKLVSEQSVIEVLHEYLADALVRKT